MSNIVGAIVGLQAHVKAANERNAETPAEEAPAEAECSCSAFRVLFLGGCKCGNS